MQAAIKFRLRPAEVLPTAPEDMFWGDRYGQLKDPFGVTWAMNQGAFSE